MKKNLLFMAQCAVFAALMCVCAPISIPLPFSPVPISLILFGAMLTGVILPRWQALTSMVVFYLVSLFLPVYAGGSTGVTTLPGPTGGYVWSLLLVVLVISFFSGKGWYWSLLGCVLGILVCYVCGTAQFCLCMGSTVGTALGLCVFPFIPVDLAKALVAALAGEAVRVGLVRAKLLTN